MHTHSKHNINWWPFFLLSISLESILPIYVYSPAHEHYKNIVYVCLDSKRIKKSKFLNVKAVTESKFFVDIYFKLLF